MLSPISVSLLRNAAECSCESRYLCPQEPPAGLNTLYKCAHYVRLLPFLEDWQMFEGVDDMWCTSQQFLVRSCGGVLTNLQPPQVLLLLTLPVGKVSV